MKRLALLLILLIAAPCLMAPYFPPSGGGVTVWPGTDATASGPNCTLSNFSVDGVLNPLSPQFKASGSSQSTTGTISAGSHTLTLASKLDFANGEGIVISQAGPANTAGVPTSPSAALPAWPGAEIALPYNSTGSGHQYIIQPVNNNAANNIYEVTGVTSQGITADTESNWASSCATANSTCVENRGITWTQHTASYTTTWTYKLAAIDSNFGVSAATAAFTCTAASNLSELSPCEVKWTAGANDVGVLIYRGGSLIAAVPASDASFNDTGYIAGGVGVYWPDFPTSPPASALPGRLVTTISSGAGTTNLTLAAPATTVATSQAVNHDDTVALQAWSNALLATSGSAGYCPTGTYQITASINLVASSTAIGVHISGPAGLSVAPAGCNLIYNGDPTKAALYTNRLWNSTFDHMTFNANALALYAVQVDNSDGSHPSSEVVFDKISAEKVSPSINAAGIEFGHPGMGAWEVGDDTVKDSFIYNYDGGPSNIASAGIRTVLAAGNLEDFYFYRNTINGFANAYDLGGTGTTVISAGNILGGTGTDVFDRGADITTVTGLEDQGDFLTGSAFFSKTGQTQATLSGNSWDSAAQTSDVVVNVTNGVLIGNRFQNQRTSSSLPIVIAHSADNFTPGTANVSSLFSLYNTYLHVGSPYLPPIYDGSGNQVVDLVNGYPFNATANPPGVFSIGDMAINGSGALVALKPVNAYGGDQVLTRLFATGVAGLPIMDANGGSPLLENFTTALGTKGVGTVPNTIANLAACNSGNEGLIARQTNSTAACSSGVTATTGGTTHCFVGCNGTNWIQFGF